MEGPPVITVSPPDLGVLESLISVPSLVAIARRTPALEEKVVSS